MGTEQDRATRGITNTVLVTGGCGFLGSWIARLLVEEGKVVRVLALPGEPRTNLAGVDVELVEGDICSIADCRRAVKDCETVFHAAALYLDWAPDPSRMYDVNLRGTFNVLEASRREGVKTVVHTASIVSLGRPDLGAWGDEDTPYEAWEIDFPYSRSKLFSRELAEYFADWGMDVRVVCPGIVLGPNDLRPTPSGKLILQAMKGGPGVYFKGGANYVDVRDAARVHLLAASRGQPHQRYLATAHNMTNRDLVTAIDGVLGRKRRLMKLPVSLARAAAIGMDVAARRTGKPPILSRVFFEYSLKPSFYDSRRSQQELGAAFRPIDETIADAVGYFRAHGMA